VNKKNLISIVIPVFNGAKFISKALDSVFNQNYTSIEVIVVDDGSTDTSNKIIKSYDVTYFRQNNLGVASARNRGIELAKGEFIAFLDQDDIWLPDKLRKQINHLQNHQNIGYVISKQMLYLEDGLERPAWLKKELLDTPLVGYLPSTLMVRKEVFNTIGMFDSTYIQGSDTDWFFRAYEKNIGMEIINDVLVLRTIHSSNSSHEVGNIHHELLKLIQKSLFRRRLKENK